MDNSDAIVRIYVCVETRVSCFFCYALFGAKSVVKLEAIGPIHKSLELSFLIES